MQFEPIVVLLLFSLFFCFMVVIVLYISFHGIGTSSVPQSGILNVFNFYTNAVWITVMEDSVIKYQGPLAPGMSYRLQWTQSRTVQYTISKEPDPNAPDSFIVSKIVDVTPESSVLVVINTDGSYFEMFSKLVNLS